VLFINDYGAQILGRGPSDLRGRPLAEVFGSMLLSPPALLARTAHEGMERLELVYSRGEDVRELGFSVSALATGQPDGGGYLLVFADVTDLKRLEREVRAKENLAAAGEMAAQMAHEIRNPLASISGSAQMLMAEPGLSTDQSRLLAIITRESKRLSDTLSQFLVQARPGSPRMGPVDLGPVVEEALALLRNSPEVGPGHDLVFDRQGGPHVCLADPAQITQVFWNLARNALEAMPGGGALRLRLRAEDGDAVLSVIDQGRGITRADERRIFQPFQSGGTGTGLGLAIVYQIVRAHHGDITVRSNVPRGTVVEVRLPLVRTAVPA
jgi:two-component system sensor histidine kinase PilS (NtrC family)